MKKLLIILPLLLIFILSSCDLIEDIKPTSEQQVFQTNLITSRDKIRETNVNVHMKVYETGRFTNRFIFDSQASGILYAKDEDYYYILTNFHVIDSKGYNSPEYSIEINQSDLTIDANLVYSDELYDLAVLKFPKNDLDLPLININLRLYEPLKVGEIVLAVGSPSNVNAIVTYGEYVGLITIDQVDFKVIYHNALIYQGNSGGALTDVRGNLVGINTWGTEINTGSLSIPLDIIHDFLQDMETTINEG